MVIFCLLEVLFSIPLLYLFTLINIKFAGVDVKVYRDGKLLSPSQVEKEYHDWILQMHKRYDEEVDHGEDQPVIVVSPGMGKEIGITSDGRHERINTFFFVFELCR